MTEPLLSPAQLLSGLGVAIHPVEPGRTQRYLTPLLKTGRPALQSPVALYSPPVSDCAVAAAPCREILITPHTEGREVVTVISGSENQGAEYTITPSLCPGFYVLCFEIILKKPRLMKIIDSFRAPK